jgi:hypothetical protein
MVADAILSLVGGEAYRRRQLLGSFLSLSEHTSHSVPLTAANSPNGVLLSSWCAGNMIMLLVETNRRSACTEEAME